MSLRSKKAKVALLAEGVDRNRQIRRDHNGKYRSPSSRRAWIEITIYNAGERVKGNVALLAEGVDRNATAKPSERWLQASPSSRRAWIEISQ